MEEDRRRLGACRGQGLAAHSRDDFEVQEEKVDAVGVLRRDDRADRRRQGGTAAHGAVPQEVEVHQQEGAAARHRA